MKAMLGRVSSWIRATARMHLRRQIDQLCQLAKEVEGECAEAADGLPRGKDGRVLWFACTDQQLAAHALRSGRILRAEQRLEKIIGAGVELVQWAPGKWFAKRPAGAVWVELVEGRTDLQLRAGA
jgi:hypothetical protein